MAKQSEYMQQRYGYKRPTRLPRILSIVVMGIVIAASGFYLVKKSANDVTFRLTSFNVLSDKAVQVQWQVARPSGTTIYCVIRAQNDQRVDVGYATVTIDKPGSVREVNVVYTLNTESKAVLAEVLGCSKDVIQRVAPANFPPGVEIPAQMPPGVAPTRQ